MKPRTFAVAAIASLVVLTAGCSATDASEAAPTSDALGETRTVATAFGEVEIPADPQRIVLVRASALDSLLALGVELVGTTYWGGAGDIQSFLQDQVSDDVVTVGNDDEPDFEAIASLEPDLIIADETIEDALPRLEDIAPVAAYQRTSDDGRVSWLDHIVQLADIVGQPAPPRP